MGSKVLKTIIISRTDSIGDVVLTLPLAGYLRQTYPEARILFLGSSYTRPVLECSENIDQVLEWDKISDHAVEEFNKISADCILHVFPRAEIARAAKQAGIPLRIGTSHRWYHWLYCNQRPGFTRKGSDLHEAQLNFKLLNPIGHSEEPSLRDLGAFMGFKKIRALDEGLAKLIDPDKYSLIIHPGSRGSAQEWGLDQFMMLTQILNKEKYQIFLTGTEEEGRQFSGTFDEGNIINLCGKLSLTQLISFINHCDGLVAASTGPLHLAAVLGKRAVGLFAKVRPIHPGRWAPIGEKAVVLQAKISCEKCRRGRACDCLSTISPEEVAGALGVF